MAGKGDDLRRIPSVDAILKAISGLPWGAGVQPRVLKSAVRSAVTAIRVELTSGKAPGTSRETLKERVLEKARKALEGASRPFYRKAINATGIILHTGLGRAVLAKQVIEQFTNELSGYSVLQIDVESGDRSKREGRVEELLKELTGAEAATVVNNNAAATSIVLNAVAVGREVIVSRGQLVEIGGSYRLPEVMAASGAKLVEVGTTNKTHARDYESAITPDTAAIMRVHPSNYRIYGFTSEVGIEELERIAHAHNLVLIDDIGSGALIDFSRFGLKDEPMLAHSLKAGADVVTCSADKLIGGPQAGIILGRAGLISAIRKSPLARILRVDKLTLAALEATLTLFLDEETAVREVPTLAMIALSRDEIARRAESIARRIKAAGKKAVVSTIDGTSQVGSGSMPTQDLPTRLVAISPERTSVDALALALRRGEPPVVARIQKDLVLIDPRTLLPGEDKLVVEAVVKALSA